MNIDDFIDKQLDLIEIEKSAEVTESKAALQTYSLNLLQAKGICLLKLKIDGKKTGLYGRSIVILNSSVPGKIINTQYFSIGDIVSISENSLPTNELLNEKCLSGTVIKVTDNSISVAFDTEADTIYEELNDDTVYKLIKLANDVTHKRIKNAILAIKNYSKLNPYTTQLCDIIFENAMPSEVSSASAPELDYYNKGLDESQKNAIKFTFKQKNLAIIHGPPGTGKTTTLVEIIKQCCLKYKQKVLCCAPSNIAVDNLVERLIPNSGSNEKVKLIRLGHPARLLEKIQDYSLDSMLSQSDQSKLIDDIRTDMDKARKGLFKCSKTNNKGERENLRRDLRELRKELYTREEKAIKDVLKSADCILATLTTGHKDGPLKHINNEHFDVIIIDECSQALEVACWIPLVIGAKKLIIAGDHLQLPPTIISHEAAEKGLEVTLMKRLIDKYGDECTRMLTTQYRMNNIIMSWISERLYESRLEAHTSVAEHLLCDMNAIESNENTQVPLVLIDTHGCEMYEMVSDSKLSDDVSKANLGEANIACKHALDLLNSGLKQEQIAIISPYNLQIELIRNRLHKKYPKIEVKSVDGFQGREKEAVILTLVRSNKNGEVGFLADQRRINVAITRARRHLCVVCDTQTCKTNEFLKSFIDYCNEHGDVRSGFDYENNMEELEENLEVIGAHGLKYVEKKAQNVKKPEKKAESQKSKQKTEPAASKPFEATDEDKKFEESVVQIIKNLKANEEYKFDASLNARQRRIVHTTAEVMNIFHLSQGENESRCIKISKKPIKLEEVVVQQTKDAIKEEEIIEPGDDGTVDVVHNRFDILSVSDDVEPKPKKKSKNKKQPEKATIQTSSLLGAIDDTTDDYELKYRADCKQCNYCTKFILKSNYTMHEMHCSKINQMAMATKSKQNQTESKASNEKQSFIKEDRLKSAQTNDFDELIAISQQMNNVCNFKKCKTLVQTLGHTCEYCKHRFCLKHSLAEEHGCGDAARQEARAHIRQTGNLNVNASKSNTQSYTEKIRHDYAAKKLSEKINKMQDSRSTKTNPKK